MSSAEPNAAPAIGENLSLVEKLGEVLFRLRDYTPIPLVILALLYANPTEASFVIGLIVVALGEFARTYGVAFIGSISRTRSYSNGELVKSGPFSLLRNPLYFGNLVLSLGLSIMPAVTWLPLVVVVVFYAQYIPIVKWEEMKLRRIFGEKYAAYCNEVPQRWFPSLSKLLRGGWYVAPESWKPALKSEKRTLTSVISYLIIMSAFMWFRSTGQLELPVARLLGLE